MEIKENNVAVISPWAEGAEKLKAIFKYDEEVHVEYGNTIPEVTLLVDNHDKYEALVRIIPQEIVFGNVTLKITLMPVNFDSLPTVELFRRAFKENAAVEDIITIARESVSTTNDFNYVVGKKEVVQYHNDTLGDPHGICSTLFENLFRDIFGDQGGIYFCTSRE